MNQSSKDHTLLDVRPSPGPGRGAVSSQSSRDKRRKRSLPGSTVRREGRAISTATHTIDHPAATADRRVRVLLVEDTDTVRRAVGLGLRSSGFEVTAVRGAEDALAVYSAVQPEVIITDLAMPGMDGFELIATLRVRGGDAPVLVITARDAARARAAASAAGADGYLLKPFGLAELCSTVTALAARRATIHG